MFEYYKGFDDFVRKLEKFCQKYQLDNKKKKSGFLYFSCKIFFFYNLEGKLDF